MREHGVVATRVCPDPGEPIEIQVMSENFLDIFDARDISVSGIGIFVPYRFEGCYLKSPVDLVITLPGSAPFLAKGRIVHRTKTSREFFGVEFVGVPFAHSVQIMRYVERRLAQNSDCGVAGSPPQ